MTHEVLALGKGSSPTKMVQVINECLTFLSFYIYAPECYSESEHDDPEITETPPPPYTAQPLPPHLVCITVISLFPVTKQRA